MALPAANMRFGHGLLSFIAVSGHFDLFDQAQQRAPDLGVQFHILASVRPQDIRDWAFLAEVRSPMIGRRRIPNQTAFLALPATEIVPVEILAFEPGRRSHKRFSLLADDTKTCPRSRGQDGIGKLSCPETRFGYTRVT